MRPVREPDLPRRAGRGGGHRRGIGLGQVADGAGGGAAHRGARQRDRHAACACWAPTCCSGAGATAPPLPGHLAVDGVPGSGHLVQPHPPGRRAAGRGGPLPPGHEPLGGTRPRRRPPACRPRAGARTARRPVPARVLGRHAAARHDRHGRSWAARPSSSPTSPPPRSTSPSRSRCSSCCSRSARPMASPSCSSATTWPSSAQLCDRVLVMYAGRIVEDLPAGRAGHRRPASLHAGARGGRAGHGERPGPAAGRHPGPAGGAVGGAARLRLRRSLPAGRPALPGPRTRRWWPTAPVAAWPAGMPASPSTSVAAALRGAAASESRARRL